MRGFLHGGERDQPDLVGQSHFFQGPTNAGVARESLSAVGQTFKTGNGEGHRASRQLLYFGSVNKS